MCFKFDDDLQPQEQPPIGLGVPEELSPEERLSTPETQAAAKALVSALTIDELKALAAVLGLGGAMIVDPLLALGHAEDVIRWVGANSRASTQAVAVVHAALKFVGVPTGWLDDEIAAVAR